MEHQVHSDASSTSQMTVDTDSSSTSKVNISRNPFENSKDKINFPDFSPSLYGKTSKSTKHNKEVPSPFRWSIDQLAVLQPADINEIPEQQSPTSYERPDDEVIAQKATDEFFSKAVVPSPWGLQTPACKTEPSSSWRLGVHEWVTPSLRPKSGKMEAACQTMLSLPLDFDLEALIGSEWYSCLKDEESSVLNTSLKRKLFATELCTDDRGDAASPKSVTAMAGWSTPSPDHAWEEATFVDGSLSRASFLEELPPSPTISPIRTVSASSAGPAMASQFQDTTAPPTETWSQQRSMFSRVSTSCGANKWNCSPGQLPDINAESTRWFSWDSHDASICAYSEELGSTQSRPQPGGMGESTLLEQSMTGLRTVGGTKSGLLPETDGAGCSLSISSHITQDIHLMSLGTDSVSLLEGPICSTAVAEESPLCTSFQLSAGPISDQASHCRNHSQTPDLT